MTAPTQGTGSPLIPQAFWFRLSTPCTRVDGLPRTAGARLLDLPEACRLPTLATLDDKPVWADVRVAWSPAGLAVQVDAQADVSTLGADDRPEVVQGLQLWVDTRDTRDVSRATRFCHRFDVPLSRGSSVAKNSIVVKVQPKPIARAIADPPMAKTDEFPARASKIKGGWRLELFLPATALNGFDPETNRRLGFAYRVADPGQEDQFLGPGREFPVGENPSLWSTLELVEPT